jgi:hypothetical protein
VGNENSHRYIIDYVNQFLRNYKGLNKFAFMQSLTGHEDSGTVIATLDQDLPDMIDSILHSGDEVVLFLMADHGMRYGEWFKLLDGSHEHKLPAMFVVASTSLMDSIEYSYDTMTHNTFRLNSKLDIHHTLMHLANWPYKQEYTMQSDDYFQWGSNQHESVGLFLEKIPNSRTCESVGIPFYY